MCRTPPHRDLAGPPSPPVPELLVALQELPTGGVTVSNNCQPHVPLRGQHDMALVEPLGDRIVAGHILARSLLIIDGERSTPSTRTPRAAGAVRCARCRSRALGRREHLADSGGRRGTALHSAPAGRLRWAPCLLRCPMRPTSVPAEAASGARSHPNRCEAAGSGPGIPGGIPVLTVCVDSQHAASIGRICGPRTSRCVRGRVASGVCPWGTDGGDRSHLLGCAAGSTTEEATSPSRHASTNAFAFPRSG